MTSRQRLFTESASNPPPLMKLDGVSMREKIEKCLGLVDIDASSLEDAAQASLLLLRSYPSRAFPRPIFQARAFVIALRDRVGMHLIDDVFETLSSVPDNRVDRIREAVFRLSRPPLEKLQGVRKDRPDSLPLSLRYSWLNPAIWDVQKSLATVMEISFTEPITKYESLVVIGYSALFIEKQDEWLRDSDWSRLPSDFRAHAEWIDRAKEVGTAD